MAEEKKYQLAKGVNCCLSRKGVIEDHEPRPASEWGDDDEVIEKVKDGFLVEAKQMAVKKEPVKV